jgi:uncharacterized protein
VILCDAGPLIALIDVRDRDHSRCKATLAALATEPLLTTWPCLTEAMYFAGKVGGHHVQEKVWQFIVSGAMQLHDPQPSEWSRARDLMRLYANVPMDFADASLVSAGERTGIRRVFTLDHDFHVYRLHGKDTFTVVP